MSTLNDFNYVNGATSVLAQQVNALLGASLRSEYKNVETLSATRTLLDVDTPIQRFDCNSANRDLKAPTANAVENHNYLIVNDSAGTELLTVKNNAGTETLTTLSAGEVVLLLPNGNGEYVVFISSASSIIQVVNTQTGAVATGTTLIPTDDTIPQNTEGDQYMSLAITPKSASNILVIDVTSYFSHTAISTLVASLFQDSTANALAVGVQVASYANAFLAIHFRHYMAAGTISATTFKVRVGSNAAGTTTFNGISGARILGGALASSITITEIKV